ncbi:MAG: membrane integrity-associated transporter subunit PqiC [Myxococcales bacterium]|nr:membrane integrity-associated transporter subunit PqiC [Myxococcales bacterium]
MTTPTLRNALLAAAAITTSVAALLCAGCFGSPAKPEYYYFLSGPTAVVEKKGDGPTLAVNSFSHSPGYDARSLAYRTGDNELRYYGYRRWLAEPASLVRDMTIRHLRASGMFSAVQSSSKSEGAVDALLEGRVVAMEEVDKDNDHWNARLAMVFVLRDERSARVILRHAFDVTRPATRRHPQEIARLISKILAQQLDTLIRKVHRALARKKARNDARKKAAAERDKPEPKSESDKVWEADQKREAARRKREAEERRKKREQRRKKK